MSTILNGVGFFRLARRSSLESDYRFRVGAVLVSRSGRPISFGWNKLKTHPIFANPFKTVRTTIHAEMDCVKNISKDDLVGSTMYVYRESLVGDVAMARPCSDCMGYLISHGVGTIFYSTSTPPYFRKENI